MLYVSKPQHVEAVQWRGRNAAEVVAFGTLEITAPDGSVIPAPKVTVDELTAGPVCRLLAGAGGAQEWVPVPIGHWLVNVPGDKTDIWPVAPDYFTAKYDFAGE